MGRLSLHFEVCTTTFCSIIVSFNSRYITYRWIFQNKELFANKIVLELGAGCGLCGLVAGLYASKVVLTDYLDVRIWFLSDFELLLIHHQEVVQTLKENVELNSRKLPKSKYYCTQLDFKRTEIIPHPSFLKQKVDIILGSEIMYEVRLFTFHNHKILLIISLG